MAYENNSVGKCATCGKQCFITRKAAKAFMNRKFPNEKMTTYRCGDYFHFGHTPYGIKRGIQDRREWSLDRRKP